MNCKHCNGEMKPGKAIENTFTGMPDFPGDKHVVTLSPGGPGKLIDCLKCVSCGWSMTEPGPTLPTMTDALAAGDGCLHARIDALEAQVAADKKYVKELEDANTPELVSLREQVATLHKALNGFIANSCRVDWPADIYDAAIAAQKGTV